jgi:acyl carrier protein
MAETIDSVVTKAIAKQINLDPALVALDATLDELGVTSLDLVEIIMTIEDEYDVTVPLDANEASQTIKTVSDIVALGHSLNLDAKR